MDKVNRFLMASYQYYIKYELIMSDYDFDILCRDLLKIFNIVEHKYKDIITEDMSACGTGHNLRIEDYPEELIEKSERLKEEFNDY